jgi:hypothetical protein
VSHAAAITESPDHLGKSLGTRDEIVFGRPPAETPSIVEEVRLPEERRHNDLPYKFYGISDSGREFLAEHKLLRAQDTLRAIYDRVEKTEDVTRYETALRPER